MSVPIRRALLSVSDKTGVVDFARALHARGIALLSTGGTAKTLAEAGLPVRDVSEHTGFPEMMDGRLKTLHPKVHGGLLGRRGKDDAVMAHHGIAPIDLLVVNLYPFEQTVARAGCTLEQAIENIDIGGPAMLRAAAKNHQDVTVVVDTGDYDRVLAVMEANHGGTTHDLRFELACKVYAHTARYDGAIANYLSALGADGVHGAFPRYFTAQYEKAYDVRYGENPHQAGAFFVERGAEGASLATAQVLQGRELSYNNIADADAALECVRQFDGCACVIVKHANPCGVALGASPRAAYERAWQTDPESAFGGIIAFNRPLDGDTARLIIERQFVEVILAPEVSPEAATAVAAKKNVRLLATGPLNEAAPHLDFKRVTGGLLVQQADLALHGDLKVVTRRAPSDAEMSDLLFAWRVAKFVKSNAIVYAREHQTVGVGAGQMSRVNSARIAAIKAEHAGLAVRGSVMASDAFFPFRDGIDAAAQAGVAAVIQPGGSVKDAEVIAAADEHGLAMVFTGMRHFRH